MIVVLFVIVFRFMCLFAVRDNSYLGLDFFRIFVNFVGMFIFHGFSFLSLSHFSCLLNYYLSSLNSAPRVSQISSICYMSSRISHFQN